MCYLFFESFVLNINKNKFCQAKSCELKTRDLNQLLFYAVFLLLYIRQTNFNYIASIAQLGERQTEDLKVAGSIPARSITFLL
jgi:hypothetical protein